VRSAHTGAKPNLKKLKEYVDCSLMVVTALAPVIFFEAKN
jgi:fumarate hydratase class II